MWPGRLGVVFTNNTTILPLASVNLNSKCTHGGRVGAINKDFTSRQVVEALLHLGADVHLTKRYFLLFLLLSIVLLLILLLEVILRLLLILLLGMMLRLFLELIL